MSTRREDPLLQTQPLELQPFSNLRVLAGALAGLMLGWATLAILGPDDSPWLAFTTFVLLLLVCFEWLRGVYRLHAALAAATSGRYPIKPWIAVALNLVPIVNLFWIVAWPLRIARFAARNGQGRSFDGYLPGALVLLAFYASWVVPSSGVLPMLTAHCFALAYVQIRLVRALSTPSLVRA